MMRPVIAIALVLPGIDIITMFAPCYHTQGNAGREHRNPELFHLPHGF